MTKAQQLVEASTPDPLAEPVVQHAVQIYLRCNPEQAEPPSLGELIRWLRGRGGMAYARHLEYRLIKINHYLEAYGSLAPGQRIVIDSSIIFAMRMLAGFKPLLHTAASGKVRRNLRGWK